jgi:hypothetical protein
MDLITTGSEMLDKALIVFGALSSFLTALATVLPRDWAATRLFAKFGADIKGVLASAGKEEKSA